MISALTPLAPNTVELIPSLGALSPRGGPVQDPVLTEHTVAVLISIRMKRAVPRLNARALVWI